MTAEEELKKLMKDHTKKEKKSVFIQIRAAKEVKDMKLKEIKDGIIEIRLHSTAKGFPKWYLHGYLIHLKHFGLYKKKFKKDVMRAIFANVKDAKISLDSKSLIEDLIRDYGDIIPNSGTNILLWRTERFKKIKDPFRRVYKTM